MPLECLGLWSRKPPTEAAIPEQRSPAPVSLPLSSRHPYKQIRSRNRFYLCLSSAWDFGPGSLRLKPQSRNNARLPQFRCRFPAGILTSKSDLGIDFIYASRVLGTLVPEASD